jgi:hypothetical protein
LECEYLRLVCFLVFQKSKMVNGIINLILEEK